MLTRREFLRSLGLIAAAVPVAAAIPASTPELSFEDAIVEAGVRQSAYDDEINEMLKAHMQAIEYCKHGLVSRETMETIREEFELDRWTNV